MKEVLRNEKAAKKFKEMIIAQGVEREKANNLCENPANVLPIANITSIRSEKSGTILS